MTPPAEPVQTRNHHDDAAGQSAGKGVASETGGASPAKDGMAKTGPAPDGQTNANPNAPRLDSAGGWSDQGGPEFVGDLGAAAQAAGQTGGTSGNAATQPAVADTAAAPATTATASAPTPEIAAAQTAAKPASAKSVDASSEGKSSAEGSVAPATANGDARAAAGSNPAGQNANPPVNATQGQAPAPAPAQAQAATPVTTPAEAAVTANSAVSASNTATAQSLAAGTANAAVADTAPAGRFAQARQGVDERDNALAATRSKGKSSANGVGQTNAKQQAGAASPQPQASAANPSAPRPDAAAANRDVQITLPQTPAAAPAPLATDGMRAGTPGMDPAMTTITDTRGSSLRGAAPASAEANASQAPRFTQQSASQLAAQISQRYSNGSRVFGIRLDPAELGRVDIQLKLGQNNKVHATLTVERGDTLAEMQRSTRDLERALNEAGLELEEEGLTFQLSEGSGDGQSAEPEQGNHFNVYGQDDESAQDLAAEIETGPADAYGFRLSRRDGVDLRV